MTRADLLMTLRDQGVDVRPYDLTYALERRRFDPMPERDGSGRYVYLPPHVGQLRDLVAKAKRRRTARDA